ncbi:UPF0149 family protein [Pseudoalteromonas byunsanensis]
MLALSVNMPKKVELMSELNDYVQAQLLLEKHDIYIAPAEVHGAISGLLACGLNIEEKEYLGLLSDVFNEGQAFQEELKQFFAKMYKHVVEHFSDDEFHFELFLPSEDESLIDQANALVGWVSGFLLGFGLKQKDYGKLSVDVKEVISDFTEITKLDTHFDDTEEDQQALHEIIEYIRVSAMLCFAEMGKDLTTTSKTIH